MASAGFLGKFTGTLRKDLDWKTAEPRDGWGDATTNGRGGPRAYAVVGGLLVSDRLGAGSATFFLVTQFKQVLTEMPMLGIINRIQTPRRVLSYALDLEKVLIRVQSLSMTVLVFHQELRKN